MKPSLEGHIDLAAGIDDFRFGAAVLFWTERLSAYETHDDAAFCW